MNNDQPILVLVAGHIINFSRCNYAYLDGSTIIVEYPDETLEVELDSDTAAAVAMLSITNQLAERGHLVSAVPK
jgi:prepilin-type processing-associated H-X9-DG protein